MSPRVPVSPIDTAPDAPFVLHGRIVTMDDDATVLDHGALYAGRGPIAAVQDAGAAPPPGFEDVVPVDVEGTIYPGLIELHNHLSYNVLPMWPPPTATLMVPFSTLKVGSIVVDTGPLYMREYTPSKLVPLKIFTQPESAWVNPCADASRGSQMDPASTITDIAEKPCI
jgi:hypothetical protein